METTDYSRSQTLNNTTATPTSSKSYSSVVIQDKFPSKEQAIIFGATENTRLQDYLIPLGSIIQPKNILFSSRLSNQRICMYLASREVVEDFMNKYGSIEVNNQIIKARRLVTPAQRLVLSNVCPSIPHDLLAKELQNLGLKLISPINFLRINAQNPEYSHILSFRRQVYVSSSNCNLPDSIVINFDETSYRIFLSQDTLTCYSCKKAGHKASECKEATNEISQGSFSKKNHNTEPNIENVEQNVFNENNITPLTPSNDGITSKRSVEEILTPTDENTPQTAPFAIPQPVEKSKKFKPSQVIKSNLESLRPAKNFIENLNPKPILSFDQIVMLFDNIQGSPDPISIIKEFTTDYLALVHILRDIYPYLTERAIKTRCTKLKKKLLNLLGNETTEEESDSSQDCY